MRAFTTMKASTLSSLLLFSVTGCGVFSALEEEPAPLASVEAPTPGRPDAPPPPLQGTPITSEIDESFGVFVTSNAPAGGDGTRARPFGSIAAALDSAKTTRKRIYVCEGTYRESFALVDGVSMVGGLDCSSATWSLGNARSRIESPSTPAITAKNIETPTRFDRFEVTAPDGTTATPTSITLFAVDASALTIAKSRLVAGNGADGADGIEPAATVVTGDPNGKLGFEAREYCWWTADKNCAQAFPPDPYPGAAGGSTTCNGAPGGAGGRGGRGGIWQSVWRPELGSVGWTIYQGMAPQSGGAASGGVIDGANGTSAALGATFTRDGFVPANGTSGTNGSIGRNGAGGSGYGPTASPHNQDLWYGNGGSGGGAGGCGGVAGSEGKGGGASLAAFVVGGDVAFVASELVAKNGGNGGKGTFGSAPTPGGKGGPMVNGIAVTKGEDGTAGGHAGVSGSGAGGPSIALVAFAAKPSVDGDTTLAFGKGGNGVGAMTNGAKTIGASVAGEAAKHVGISP